MRSQVEQIGDGAIGATLWISDHVDFTVIPGTFPRAETAAALRRIADFIESGSPLSDEQLVPSLMREALEHDRRRRIAERGPAPEPKAP